MSRCYCGCLLGILVIVFAWIDVSWAKYVLTVVGVIVALKAIAGNVCCCCAGKKEEAAPDVPAEND